MERCGGNDVFLTASTAGTFGAPVQISHGSSSDGLVAAQAAGCAQAVCSTGDVTGWWPAIGIDSKNNATMAYPQTFTSGFAMDDFAKADVEFCRGERRELQGPHGRTWRGAGTPPLVLAFTPRAGLPAVLSDNATGMAPGVYLDLDQTSGGFAAVEADGGWTSSRVSSGAAGEQLGFAINAQGLFAAAYYDMTTSTLVYVTSMDGMTWSSPMPVDQNGSTGLYPSLAFDANGDPAIAYYRCNGQTGLVCNDADDGLYLARLQGGTWTPQLVLLIPADSGRLVYPALARSSGESDHLPSRSTIRPMRAGDDDHPRMVARGGEMTRWVWPLLVFFPLLSCSGNSNSLSGCLGDLYDLSFKSVNLILQATSIEIQYVNDTSGDPASSSDFKNIENVAGSSIDLAQLDNGQPRGVLQMIGTVTTDFPIQRGSITFNQTPKVGQQLSGVFAVTVSSPVGYTLDGDFSGSVTAP